jgi:MFS family permease
VVCSVYLRQTVYVLGLACSKKGCQLTGTPYSYRQLLQMQGMPELLLTACLSRLAGRMLVLAIVLYVLERLRSPVLAGWVSFASIAPGLVVSPLAGALLDRIGAAKAIVVDMAASAMLLFVLTVAGVVGLMAPPLLLLLMMLFSLTSPLSTAGIRTLIPSVVPKDALDRANALDTSSYALIDVLGPALAGVLFGFAGPDATMFVIALLYVLASLSLVPLARRAPARRSEPPRSLIHEAIAGVAYVVRHRSLRGLAVSYALYQVSWGILVVAVPVTVVHALGAGAVSDSVTGGLWAIAGVAGGLGALCAGHLRTTHRERQFIAIGTLASAVAIYPISVVLGLAGLTLGLALVGFFAGPVDVGVLSLRQRRTEASWFGRVLAVSMSLNMSGLPLGSALGGVLVTQSLPAAFAVAAIASVLSGLTAYALVPARPDKAAQ